MGDKSEIINQILAEWDPIGVGCEMACEEYIGYVPLLLQFCHDKEKMKECLLNILIHEIGIEYDVNNEKYTYDLQQTCDRIIQKCNET